MRIFINGTVFVPSKIPSAAPSLQRTQIIRHIAELPDHLGITEIAGSRVTRAAECDRADMTFLSRQRLSAHYSRVGVDALGRFIGAKIREVDTIFGFEKEADALEWIKEKSQAWPVSLRAGIAARY
jgi:hypothetical protein